MSEHTPEPTQADPMRLLMRYAVLIGYIAGVSTVVLILQIVELVK